MAALPEANPQGARMENQRLESSFVDPGSKTSLQETTRVTGTISGPGDLSLAGALDGDIMIQGLLILGENGSVKGKITAGNMILAGHVQGRIAVTGMIEIRSSGHVLGNIVCQKIVIAEGAYLDGEVHTHKGKPLSPSYFTEKRKDLQTSEE
jgi:cytoskeletal protein CcmA (bactofilin family)